MQKEREEELVEACKNARGRDAVAIVKDLMKLPFVPMHGPVHHVIDGCALLTAMHNAGAAFSLEEAVHELIYRGEEMPGGSCGLWGMCGSSSSAGAALAIVHGTGPLSGNRYYKDNLQLTSKALGRIGEIGGPRCCKRNAYLSLSTAIAFVKDRYGLPLEQSPIVCEFSPKNEQCLKRNCPFYPENHPL